MTSVIFNLLVKIFVLTIFGFICKKTGIINDTVQSGINSLLIKAILPVTILMSSQNVYSTELAGNMLVAFLFVSVYYMIALVIASILGRFLKLGKNKQNVFVTMITFANVGFIGFPISLELYGTEGVLYTVVYNMVYQLLFYTYGVALLSGDKSQMKPLVLLKTPVTLASFTCVLLFLLQVKFPECIAAPLQTIGSMTTPLSLMLVGCSLCDAKIGELLTDKYSYIVSAMRMLVLPAIMLVILMLLKLPPVLSGTCAVLTALPSGSLNVIYAQDYHCEPEFASRTVIQTMVVMIVTLPLMIYMINDLL